MILFCSIPRFFIALWVKNRTMGKQSDLTIFDLVVRIKQLEDRFDQFVKQPPVPQKMPKYVDLSTAAHFLGISRTSLYKLMNEGKLSFVQVGRQRRILVADLEKYLEGDYVPTKPSII